MHRTVLALIEAERIGAIAAVMLVLSFADRPRFEVRLRRFYLLHGRQGRARLSRLRKRSRETRLFLGSLGPGRRCSPDRHCHQVTDP